MSEDNLGGFGTLHTFAALSLYSSTSTAEVYASYFASCSPVITDQENNFLEVVPQIHLKGHVNQSSARCLETGKPRHGVRLYILHFNGYAEYELVEEENKLAGTVVVDGEEMTA